MEIRPFRGFEEMPHYAAVHNAVHPEDPVTADDIRPWSESLRDSAFFVAEVEGDVVGVAWIGVDAGRPLPEGRVLVVPEHRRQGIGSLLLAAISGAAAEHGYAEMEARVRETQPDGLAFAEHRGFVEIGRDFGLELDLTRIESPGVELPDGIEIATWAERPDATQGLYEVFAEASPDIPGEEENELETFEVWLSHHMQGPGDKPEATFVAFAGDEVVGYSKFALTEAQPTTAFHDLTGVKRAWRGKGIAGALKAFQIRWAKEHGYEVLSTQNEERNAPIRRLNERFGYRPAPGRINLRGPIASG